MELNEIYNEDCLQTMKRMKDGSIDLVVTSPPYDDLREYNGYSFPFEDIARELFRVVSDGGVVVWVVGDQSVDGSETGNSFRQALFFKSVGFNLHDTMIYRKDSVSFPDSNRYHQVFEYMFVLSKGSPKTANLLKDRKNKHFDGKKRITGSERQPDGTVVNKRNGNLLQEYGVRYNIWTVSAGHQKSTPDLVAFKHPAIFPEKLAAGHILTWSNPGDVVYDPFGGSGTTAKMSLIHNRQWIMSEISSDYCDISRERLHPYLSQGRFF